MAVGRSQSAAPHNSKSAFSEADIRFDRDTLGTGDGGLVARQSLDDSNMRKGDIPTHSGLSVSLLYADRGRYDNRRVTHPFKLLVGETEIDYKADINSCGCAESSARAFSWDGGSRGRLGVSERFQMIMKQRGGDAHGDRGDGFVVV